MAFHVQGSPNGGIRKVITLWQNYYPEGQWGWIIILCAFIVHSINHGIQLSVAAFSLPIQTRFGAQQEPTATLLGKDLEMLFQFSFY